MTGRSDALTSEHGIFSFRTAAHGGADRLVSYVDYLFGFPRTDLQLPGCKFVRECRPRGAK